MTPNELREREILGLKEQIENLREEIRQRNTSFGAPGQFPYELDLTHVEDIALSALYNRHPGAVSVDAMILRLFGAGAPISTERAAVIFRRVRDKLAGEGVEIEIDGIGTHRLTEAGFAALRDLKDRAARRGEPGGLLSGRERFSEAEDAALTERWNTRVPLPEIRTELRELGFPRRVGEAYANRAARLGLASRARVRWTEEADDIVRAGYKAKLKPAQIRNRLRKAGYERTTQAITRRFDALDLTGGRARRFSPREIEIMNDGFGKGIPITQIREALAAEGYVRTDEVLYSRRRRKIGPTRTPPARVRPVRGWRPPAEHQAAAE